MKSLKSVMIAGQRIKIQKADLDDCYGQYLHDKRIIQLHKNLPELQIIPTLRHEMLHAAFHISGISFCESFQEEACIRCIDEVFFPAYERILKRLKWKISNHTQCITRKARASWLTPTSSTLPWRRKVTLTLSQLLERGLIRSSVNAQNDLRHD